MIYLTLILAIANFFSEAKAREITTDYFKARERFLLASKELSSKFKKTDTYRFSVKDDYTVDALHFSNFYKRLIIVVSGTHGVEGPTGSAIQKQLLQRMANKNKLLNSDFLFVHAMNPWGFAHLRRNTENNVNLNRNYWMQKPDIHNAAYRSLSHWLEPTGPVILPVSQLFKTITNLGWGLLNNMSLDEFNEGIGGGQDEFPRGLEYVGEHPEPQIKWLADLLKDKASQYEEIQLYDIHTGLGHKGGMHFITGDSYNSNSEAVLKRVFPKAGPFELTTGDTPGFYHTIGDSADFLPLLLPSHISFLAMTVEFGTLGNRPSDKIKTLNRMILENQGFHYGYNSLKTEQKVKKLFVETFLPADPYWEVEVLKKSAWLGDQLLGQEQL